MMSVFGLKCPRVAGVVRARHRAVLPYDFAKMWREERRDGELRPKRHPLMVDEPLTSSPAPGMVAGQTLCSPHDCVCWVCPFCRPTNGGR